MTKLLSCGTSECRSSVKGLVMMISDESVWDFEFGIGIGIFRPKYRGIGIGFGIEIGMNSV